MNEKYGARGHGMVDVKIEYMKEYSWRKYKSAGSEGKNNWKRKKTKTKALVIDIQEVEEDEEAEEEEEKG